MLFLYSSLRPVIVEPYDVIDDVDGFPEKSITRKPQEYIKSREVRSHSIINRILCTFNSLLIFFLGWSEIR